MGPTASGKTGIALRLAEAFPLELISVDSALVYRGMDIGTAKPDPETLRRVPHALIDIRDPEQTYSAGDFVRDAHREIGRILESGRIPLLVGGTMMYFRSLIAGIAELPGADEDVRAEIDGAAAADGWPSMHAELAEVDPRAARRIGRNDSQRIQRALEVYRVSGRPLSEWQSEATAPDAGFDFIKLALVPGSRSELHRRIEDRLQGMLEAGFVAEVETLRRRPGLTDRSPSMRAVGYRQIWAHLDGHCGLDEARDRALYATRQLAKRQLTWLRADRELQSFDQLEAGSYVAISAMLSRMVGG